MLLFIGVLYYFPVYAQTGLEITGPLEAFEGDSIEFTVLYNGSPAQARVIIEDLSPAKYSNSSTGKVTFSMPSAPLGDRTYLITASIPGESSASHTILVKNRTSTLTIRLSDDSLEELNEFTITVMQRNVSVAGASVWFNSAVHLTDVQGNVTLTAPDVLVTTTYGLLVSKTGYTANSTMIIISEADRGVQVMEVIVPSLVQPNQEHIEVHVLGEQGGLNDVTLRLTYEEQVYETYQTNTQGITFINAPPLNDDNVVFLTVEKEGYTTLTGEDEFLITMVAQDVPDDLRLTVIPSEVVEGSSLTVTVTDEVGVGVEGAIIWKGALELDQLTDAEGIVSFTAPFVAVEREYYVYAVKQGYNYAQETITIRKRSNGQEELTLLIEHTVNESEGFFVTITDKYDTPLQDVVVTFQSESQLTSEDGVVSFVAPSVYQNTFYTIEADRVGYLPASTSIEVLNVAGSTEGSKSMVLLVSPSIQENNEFTVTVRNLQGFPISNARVTFLGTTAYTDTTGAATFIAPDVSWDSSYTLLATKSGYESASTEIAIKNNQGFQYWYLVIVIIIILVIGIAAYLRSR